MMEFLLIIVLLLLSALQVCGFRASSHSKVVLLRPNPTTPISSIAQSQNFLMQLWSTDKDKEVDDAVKKYGLEAGLLKTATDKDSKVKPKDLLAKYGIAYLITSITLAAISYALCYVLVANGIDVAALLEKIGIKSTQMAANTGTAAIAYVAHKAASPIRFPPTVALTPVVAGWIGKKPSKDGDDAK